MNTIKLKSGETNIWFTSDSHYWHKNICYADSTWSDKETSTRLFKSTQEMSKHIVDQINKYVKEDDILFHMGDWSFDGVQNIWNFRKQLNCKNIHLMIGNHDHHIKRNIILPNCIRKEPYSTEFIDGKYINPEYPNWVKARELFSSVHQYLEIQIDKQLVCMMHYPIASWNRQHIMIHGHTHGIYPVVDNRLDVGIDNSFKLFKEYRPFSWEDVLKVKNHTKLMDRYSY